MARSSTAEVVAQIIGQFSDDFGDSSGGTLGFLTSDPVRNVGGSTSGRSVGTAELQTSGSSSPSSTALSEFLHKLYQVFWTPTSGLRESGSGGNNINSFTTTTVDITRSRNFDLHGFSARVNRSFFPDWDGTIPPFSTVYIVLLILAFGLAVALIWLWCACIYYTMKKIRLPSWCPSKRSSKKGRRDPEDPTESCRKECFTPEILEQRRQDRLSVLQKECENLEQQLTNERSTTLTSRASDSDLEYLGALDSPPLKRNSISLQDIPQSVVRIRREKQLRQLKEEIEHLQAVTRQHEIQSTSKSPLLMDIKFEYQGSSSSTSSPSSCEIPVVEPLSQHISHLKAQRKLQEIRAEIEDLAVHMIHADEIKAKTSSLQDLPRTALGAKRQENLLSISKEIEKIKNYKLQERNIITTVLPLKPESEDKNQILAKLNKDSSKSFMKHGNASPSKSPLLRQESELSEASSTKGEDPQTPTKFVYSSSLKRTRQQELNRVRVELKELSYKLNLNYQFEEREKMLQSDWLSRTSITKENFY